MGNFFDILIETIIWAQNFAQTIRQFNLTHKCHRPPQRMRSIDDSKSICWTRCAAIRLARARPWCVGRWKVRERTLDFPPKIHRSKRNILNISSFVFPFAFKHCTYLCRSFEYLLNLEMGDSVWKISKHTIDMATRDFFSRFFSFLRKMKTTQISCNEFLRWTLFPAMIMIFVCEFFGSGATDTLFTYLL